MTCVHCGQTTLSRTYTLRFTPSRRQSTTLDLQLCSDCLVSLRSEPDIEWQAESNRVTAD